MSGFVGGVCVLMFPEGTRSRDGQIHDFKFGAFKLAHEEGVAVLPIVIDGTERALPKKSWRADSKVEFTLSIGKPVPMDMAANDLRACAGSIREEMVERLARIREGT